MARKYHGWIFAEKEKGYKDSFSTQRTTPEGSIVRNFGYGENGAASAVAYFEETLKLGQVKLEQTPIGLRVFTEEENEQ